MNFENRTLKLKAKTWSRDSYGLFDFETKKFFSQNLDIKSPGQIIRDNNDIQFVPQSAISSFKSINSPNVEILATIALENSSITLKPHTNQSDIDINQHLWQVIRHGDYDSTGYLLKCDDIIKVGRVIFKIKHIKLNEEKTGMPTTESQESILDSIKQHLDTLQPIERMPLKKDKPNSENKSATTASLCRICLSEHNDEDDPFISPCSCTGSMLNVHLLCLQRWVKTKLDIQENKNIITVYWKNLDCELCKTPLPIILRQGGQEYNLIPVDIMNVGSYIVMESLSKDKKPIGIHIIDTTGTNKITLGRGHDSDLKINDISVSRVHATMKIDKGKIYIQDNKSKFGTVVLKKNDTVFDESLTDVTLQNKRTILKFSVKRPWLTYLPCIGTKLMNSSLSVLNFKNIRSKTIADDDYDLQDQQEQTKQMDLK